MNADESKLKGMLICGLDGDQAVYHQFLCELALLLCGYVRRQLRRLNQAENDVEDIVQEALLAIHSRRHTYDRRTPVTAWVQAIARYKLIDFLRSTRHRRHDLPIDDVEEVAGDDGARMETTFDVRKMVASLPPGCARRSNARSSKV
jgi:RNA polymerase sigma-70 factor, ECF subfamily